MQIDQFGQMALQRYAETVDQYNTLIGKTKKVESREKFVETFMEEDPQFEEFNEKIERLKNALFNLEQERSAAAAPHVDAAYQEALSNVGVDPEAVKELRKQIAAGAKFLTVSYGDDVLKDAPKPEQMRAAGASTGTGGRRIRGFDWYVDGTKAEQKNSEGVLKSTATIAAKILDVAVPELQELFFKTAGSEDYKNESFPTMVEFEIAGKNVRVVKVDDSDEE